MSNLGRLFTQNLHKLSLLIQQRHRVTAPALLLAALALASIFGGLHWMAVSSLTQAQVEMDALSQEVQKLDQAFAARQQHKAFLWQLPTSADTSSITASVQRQAMAHEVGLSALSTHNEPLTSKSLAYTGWSVTLRGTYPNIKSALVDLLSLNPSVRVQTLKFTRLSTQEIEAQVSLVRWLAPPTAEPTQK